MDLGIILTALGTVATIAGVLYTFLRNFKQDIKQSLNLRLDSIEHQIAVFKSLNAIELNEINSSIRNFKNEIQEEFDASKTESKFERQEDKQDNLKYRDQVNHMYDRFFSRFDNSDREIKEIRTSVNRLEGAFYNQECCVVKEKKPRKKAE